MVAVSALMQRDHELYESFALNKTDILTDSKYKEQLQKHLDDIVETTRDVKDPSEYFLLHDAMDRWKLAGRAMKIAVDRVLVPPSKLSPRTQQKWSERNLQDWVKTKAFEIMQRRAIEWHQSRPIAEIVRLYDAHLSPEQARREGHANWIQAELYAAADVIDGRFDLVAAISPESFWRLEGKDGGRWISDIKRLKAYDRWEKRCGRWGAAEAESDYISACDELRAMLTDEQRKAARHSIAPVRAYIETSFLNADGRLALSQGNSGKKTRQWVQTKSQRLSACGINGNSTEHDAMAKDQMTRFYENIIPAVTKPDKSCTRTVLEALGMRREFEHYQEIVNCFEMAVAIYFLDPKLTASAFSD